jgi:hypothetical protein
MGGREERGREREGEGGEGRGRGRRGRGRGREREGKGRRRGMERGRRGASEETGGGGIVLVVPSLHPHCPRRVLVARAVILVVSPSRILVSHRRVPTYPESHPSWS